VVRLKNLELELRSQPVETITNASSVVHPACDRRDTFFN
jgi:hypothetical protein